MHGLDILCSPWDLGHFLGGFPRLMTLYLLFEGLSLLVLHRNEGLMFEIHRI